MKKIIFSFLKTYQICEAIASQRIKKSFLLVNLLGTFSYVLIFSRWALQKAIRSYYTEHKRYLF